MLIASNDTSFPQHVGEEVEDFRELYSFTIYLTYLFHSYMGLYLKLLLEWYCRKARSMYTNYDRISLF
jgi:hypothetical protein